MKATSLFQTRAGIFIAVLFYGLICLEFAWSQYRKKSNYYWKDSAANLGVLLGSHLSEGAFLLLELYGLQFFYERTPLRMPTTPLLWPLIFVLTDLVYYWKHRLMHTNRLLWAFHVVHHSSPYLNFTTSFRLNWFQALVNFPFFVPLALLGIDPCLLLLFYSVSAVYQFFMHTELVGPLGALEWIFNTPSHHRVHHGKNPEYLDKNFAGVFIFWDKLFGSFAPETVSPVYGITVPVQSHNPAWLVAHGFLDLARNKMDYRG